jgi:hypothetical protein
MLKKRGKTNDDTKNQFDKKRKDNKTLSKKGGNFFLIEDNKKEGTKYQSSGT